MQFFAVFNEVCNKKKVNFVLISPLDKSIHRSTGKYIDSPYFTNSMSRFVYYVHELAIYILTIYILICSQLFDAPTTRNFPC